MYFFCPRPSPPEIQWNFIIIAIRIRAFPSLVAAAAEMQPNCHCIIIPLIAPLKLWHLKAINLGRNWYSVSPLLLTGILPLLTVTFNRKIYLIRPQKINCVQCHVYRSLLLCPQQTCPPDGHMNFKMYLNQSLFLYKLMACCRRYPVGWWSLVREVHCHVAQRSPMESKLG